jgi:hypothetical protein
MYVGSVDVTSGRWEVSVEARVLDRVRVGWSRGGVVSVVQVQEGWCSVEGR